MRIDVKISDAVLQWIIHSIRLESLPPETANNLVKWASGEKTPTFNQVEKASRATGIPLGYFFLQIPPEEKIPLMEYRTVNSFSIDRPSRNLIDTIHDMEMIQSWTRDHLISEGTMTSVLINSFRDRVNDHSLILHSILYLSFLSDSCGSIQESIKN